MNKSKIQDIAYRQSLMKYAEKYGVSQSGRKYDKNRSYICFWKFYWEGIMGHLNQHTETELKLIRNMRCCNPRLGMVELRHRLWQEEYTCRLESLFRVMRRLGCFFDQQEKSVSAKVLWVDELFRWTCSGGRESDASQTFCRLATSSFASAPLLMSFPICVFWLPIQSSPSIPPLTSGKGCSNGMLAKVLGQSACRRTISFSLPIVSPRIDGICSPCLRSLLLSWVSSISLSVPYPHYKGKVERSHW